ncbi:MAG TPA: CsgG/HfaB family protein [Burkholderiaceae bacterium]|jgi:curli biogenesis system outer membrane secretion channel CsgG|nr:CsgG/HfaB family protein [Burkholderiaceae bacterium]
MTAGTRRHGVRAYLELPAWGALLLAGCAVQTPRVETREAPQSLAQQKAAQREEVAKTVSAPTLKRKIALGRISNETNYGQSLLRDRQDDPLGKQVTDLFSKALTESGAFLVLERPDIGRIKDEASLVGTDLKLVGADTLIVGSLTEFGRKQVGETGFFSATRRQVAFAKVDIRLVDVKTGHVFFATSGAGEASTEAASTLGFGSHAAYDGTLNDASVRQAVSEAVNRLINELSRKPWQTYILSVDRGRIFIAGGASQGVKPGMTFDIQTAGEQVKSPQTGFEITLPGRSVAELRIDSNFGDSETNEGSTGALVSGSLEGLKPEQLVIRAKGGM